MQTHTKIGILDHIGNREPALVENQYPVVQFLGIASLFAYRARLLILLVHALQSTEFSFVLKEEIVVQAEEKLREC